MYVCLRVCVCVSVSAAGFVRGRFLSPIFVIFEGFSVRARPILVIFAVFFVRARPIFVTLVRKTVSHSLTHILCILCVTHMLCV